MLTKLFHIEQCGNLAVASFVTPKLEGGLAMEMTNELRQRMQCDGVMFFVLDMKGIEFLSSPCLGELVSFLQDVEHVRGRIALADCHPNVAYLFKITRLDAVFHLYEDVEQAKAGVVRG